MENIIKIHSVIPSSNARTPTALIDATEIPHPIKKSVTLKPAFATFTIASVISLGRFS